ncbi:MAG: hypothetical protein K2Q14_02720 [Gammaproteobacteria bacterium]|nr:hypothetical protein [Gammaproteobacteria bacterium]
MNQKNNARSISKLYDNNESIKKFNEATENFYKRYHWFELGRNYPEMSWDETFEEEINNIDLPNLDQVCDITSQEEDNLEEIDILEKFFFGEDTTEEEYDSEFENDDDASIADITDISWTNSIH